MARTSCTARTASRAPSARSVSTSTSWSDTPARAFPGDFRLYLASQSPRRRHLLQAALIPFSVVESTGRETIQGTDPVTAARENALSKARGALLPAGAEGGAFVLGTDTVVATEEHVLGKPSGESEAGAMLATLQGREHRVISAVALRRTGRTAGPGEAGARAGDRDHGGGADAGDPPAAWQMVDHAITVVRFCPLTPPQIAVYLDTGEWRGKAGGYAIQGVAALFVEEIRGEYANVVGLPLHLLTRMFRQAGFDLLRRGWLAGREQV